MRGGSPRQMKLFSFENLIGIASQSRLSKALPPFDKSLSSIFASSTLFLPLAFLFYRGNLQEGITTILFNHIVIARICQTQ